MPIAIASGLPPTAPHIGTDFPNPKSHMPNSRILTPEAAGVLSLTTCADGSLEARAKGGGPAAWTALVSSIAIEAIAVYLLALWFLALQAHGMSMLDLWGWAWLIVSATGSIFAAIGIIISIWDFGRRSELRISDDQVTLYVRQYGREECIKGSLSDIYGTKVWTHQTKGIQVHFTGLAFRFQRCPAVAVFCSTDRRECIRVRDDITATLGIPAL